MKIVLSAEDLRAGCAVRTNPPPVFGAHAHPAAEGD